MYDICFTSSFGICFTPFVFSGCSPHYVRVGLSGVPAFAFIPSLRFGTLRAPTIPNTEIKKFLSIQLYLVYI